MFSVFNTVLVLLASLSVFPSTYFQFSILKKSLSLAGIRLDYIQPETTKASELHAENGKFGLRFGSCNMGTLGFQ